MKKKYTIETDKDGGLSNRPNRVNTVTGTVEELINYFSYTLEIGHSWDKRVNTKPKTIKSFVSNLQRSYEIQENSCYARTIVTLIK